MAFTTSWVECSLNGDSIKEKTEIKENQIVSRSFVNESGTKSLALYVMNVYIVIQTLQEVYNEYCHIRTTP